MDLIENRLDRRGARTIRLQFLRYVAAGGAALMVDVGVFAGLRMGAGLDLIASNLLGRAAGAGTAFLINRTWTFRRPLSARSGWAREAWRYAVLWLVASTVSSLGISLAAEALSAKPGAIENLIKLGVESMVLGMNFVISRHWVFRSVAVGQRGATPVDPRETTD